MNQHRIRTIPELHWWSKIPNFQKKYEAVLRVILGDFYGFAQEGIVNKAPKKKKRKKKGHLIL